MMNSTYSYISSFSQAFEFSIDTVSDLQALKIKLNDIQAWGGSIDNYDYHTQYGELIHDLEKHLDSLKLAAKECETYEGITEKQLMQWFNLYGDSLNDYCAGRIKFAHQIKDESYREIQKQAEYREYSKKVDRKETKTAYIVIGVIALIVWWLFK
ncbi:hypothetical protein CJD92_22390 [Salmonella enterica subsp. enterica serovar Newport]|nr:hypothetical protein [Salmonella enterica subsp. enterica serovar Newport]